MKTEAAVILRPAGEGTVWEVGLAATRGLAGRGKGMSDAGQSSVGLLGPLCFSVSLSQISWLPHWLDSVDCSFDRE